MRKTGLLTTVTNIQSKKKYFVPIEEPRVGGWQSAVFRKIFGPIANFWKPEFYLGRSAERAAYQHESVAIIVREVDPANWWEASRPLMMEQIEEDSQARMAAEAEWNSQMSRILSGAPYCAKE